jgi:hypothetical protein
MTLPEIKTGLRPLSGVPGARVEEGVLREAELDELVEPRCAVAVDANKATTTAIDVLYRKERTSITASQKNLQNLNQARVNVRRLATEIVRLLRFKMAKIVGMWRVRPEGQIVAINLRCLHILVFGKNAGEKQRTVWPCVGFYRPAGILA